MPTLVIGFLYIGLMIYLANIEQVQGETNVLLMIMQYGLVLIIGVWVLNAVAFVVVPAEQVMDVELSKQFERINKTLAGLFVVIGSLAIIMIVALIRSTFFHRWLEHHLFKKSKNALYSYDSTLSVHKLAIILVILQVTAIFWTLVVTGGIAGLDFSYNSPIEALGEVAIGAVIYVVIALLGVGWLTRRKFSEILQRLGLGIPTRSDILRGIGMGIALYVMLIGASTLWASVVSPDVLEQQTAASRQLFDAFNHSLLMGFALSLLTGFSEEVLFRGALQPVFGLVPTSIFFTIIHIQYALTPATLILFVVSLGFGWLRQHVSTTSAIIAHTCYNFIQFLAICHHFKFRCIVMKKCLFVVVILLCLPQILWSQDIEPTPTLNRLRICTVGRQRCISRKKSILR